MVMNALNNCSWSDLVSEQATPAYDKPGMVRLRVVRELIIATTFGTSVDVWLSGFFVKCLRFSHSPKTH
jgi:hypothetical protein